MTPDWPAPPRVRALSTTRGGGVGRGAFASLNLAAHVGDDAASVAENRALLSAAAGLPSEPCWLNQVHGATAIDAAEWRPGIAADAAHTDRSGRVLAVLTADCLPILLCDRQNDWIGAVHAGWRGLAAGVIRSALAAFRGNRGQLLAWLGPAIGPESFEIGSEVRDEFLSAMPASHPCFRPAGGDRWMADLYGLARLALANEGVTRIYGGTWCTYRDADRFYSYRRDGRTGRMATLIWLV